MAENNRIKVEFKPNAQDLSMLKRAFKTMPKDMQDILRAETQRMVGDLANKMRSKAHFAPNRRQALLVEKSIKANKDRLPSITAGGGRRVPVSRKKTPGSPQPLMGDMLFGAEFGVRQGGKGTFPQGGLKFAPYSGKQGRGSKGYFIFPTLRANQEKIRRDYLETVYKVLKRKWGPDNG